MENYIKNSSIEALDFAGKEYTIYNITKFCASRAIDIARLPYFIRVMLEMVLRNISKEKKLSEAIHNLLSWRENEKQGLLFPFYPGRVLLQDYTGIPLLVDLAAMREYVQKQGFNPQIINPVLPTALVVDHSVIAEFIGAESAVEQNMQKEFERNEERYKFIKWGAKSFKNLEVIPPGNGIVHQINLEYLAPGVIEKDRFLFSDVVIGTDSHTTMTNAISSIGWGVGGIEAEASMLGQPIFINVPKINGVKIINTLRSGITATDIALTVTNKLRQIGVTGEVVEFFGEGMTNLSIADRATIANMAPEYGALMGFFSMDNKTLEYFAMTGRSKEKVDLIKKYHQLQGLFEIDHTQIEYNRIIEIDLSKIQTCVSGPRRPEERLFLPEIKDSFKKYVHSLDLKRKSNIPDLTNLQDGDIVIAAITSCTNTANPDLILTAALIAKNAVKRGLKCPEHVLKIFAPGSRVVEEYLKTSGLLPYMEKLGFSITAYGCAACIGNIGNLNENIEKIIKENNLIVTSVLSGNRNFDARIHHLVRSNYLMSPPMVVAFALAGSINFDIEKKSLGRDTEGKPVYLQDIWPTAEELYEFNTYITNSKYYKNNYSAMALSNKLWDNITSSNEDLYNWDQNSTYIKHPPFFAAQYTGNHSNLEISNARPLLVLEDSITTDHISPAGKILAGSLAASYLDKRNEKFYNSFGARRGNHEVMLLGAFSNPGLKNLLVDKNGPYSIHLPSKTEGKLQDVANRYIHEKIPTIILAGKHYGSGSSRDFASKVTKLLGVKVVIAKSFERIHRSNLIYMGILPCQFIDANEDLMQFTQDIVLDFRSDLVHQDIIPQMNIVVDIKDTSGKVIKSTHVIVRLDNEFEVLCYIKSGILPFAAGQILSNVQTNPVHKT